MGAPLEVFRTEEAPALHPARRPPTAFPSSRPEGPPGLPHRGGQGPVLGARPYLGQRVKVRADRHLVRIYHHGVLVKTHPRVRPGERSTDQADLPPEKAAYAMRDLERLKRQAASHGAAIGAVAAAVLEGPLPWTRMRRVYRVLGLVRRYGADRVEAACAKALELEAHDVSLIARMVERAREREDLPQPPPAGKVVQLRFARLEEGFQPLKVGTR